MEISYGKSGIKNIHYRSSDDTFIVKKWIGGRTVSFGTFSTLEDAKKICAKLDVLDESNPLHVRQLQIYGQRAGYLSRERAAKKKPEDVVSGNVLAVPGPKEVPHYVNRFGRQKEELTFDAVMLLVEKEGSCWDRWKASRAVAKLLKICKKISRKKQGVKDRV